MYIPIIESYNESNNEETNSAHPYSSSPFGRSDVTQTPPKVPSQLLIRPSIPSSLPSLLTLTLISHHQVKQDTSNKDAESHERSDKEEGGRERKSTSIRSRLTKRRPTSHPQETDRDTLAKCMRVSLPFNTITAPLLYRSIRIGNKEAKGDVLYSAPREEGQKSRESMDKKACLTYVRELEIVNHAHDDCPYTQFANYKSLNTVDVLRLFYAVPVKRDTLLPARSNDHIALGASPCRVARHIHPGKLVLVNLNISQTTPLLEVPQECVHTVVTAFSYRDVPRAYLKAALARATTPFLGSTAKSKQAIYICWLPHPRAEMKLWFESIQPRSGGGVGGPSARGLEIEEICHEFISDLVDVAMDVDVPNEIIIVNIEGLGNGIRKESQRRKALEPIDPSKWEAALRYAIEHPPRDCNGRKTLKEARKITFKFISMQTYLEEYDWRGEFTAAEVEKWLYTISKRRG